MIENEEEFDINPNYNRLKDFFMDFQAHYNLEEKELKSLDLLIVLKDLLTIFPFLKKYLKQNLEKYPKSKPESLSKLFFQLKNLKNELISLKNEDKRLFSSMTEALKSLISMISAKFNEILAKETSEKLVLKQELAEILKEKTRLSEDLNKLSENLNKYQNFEEEKSDFLKKSKEMSEERENLENQRLSLEKSKEEFAIFQAQKKQEIVNEKNLILEEQKRLDNLREVVLMNEKIQQNSSFSFQNSEEKPLEKTNVTTNRGKRGRKSKFFSSFQTPNKEVSEISDQNTKSQRKTNRSIIEGLKFIHENDENQDEIEKIRELEKRTTSVNKEEILSHVFENKTRVKKKLAYFRDNFKRQKLEGEGIEKAKYRTLRESSLKKMKGILNKSVMDIKKNK